MLIASGLAFAIAECVTFLVYAGALRYGGYLVRVGEMTVESVMTYVENNNNHYFYLRKKNTTLDKCSHRRRLHGSKETIVSKKS